MNIEEYRAMIAQEKLEAEKPSEPEVVQPEAPPEPETIPPTEEQTVAKIKLGDEEFEPEQVEEFKKGYLRQQEYVERMQELERQRAEVEYALKLVEELKSDPEAYQRIIQKSPQLSPEAVKFQQLQQELEDLKVQREVDRLTAKYPDFDVQKVAEVVEQKKITNLEDAYLLSIQNIQKKEQVDVESLKAQLKAELLKEIEASSVSASLISENSNPSVPQTQTPQLSSEESKVARMMGLSESDYVKWRDKK